ncbi:hypothetical protein COD71_23575 [Bacillus cereus]|nr:hypothetical protein COD71_23575 [Bacillus cereus]
MSSKVCTSYKNRIKIEVKELQEINNYFIAKGFENLNVKLTYKEKGQYKSLTGKRLSGEVEMQDIVQEYLYIHNHRSFVYLISLWEAFVKDFIKEQAIPPTYISSLESIWSKSKNSLSNDDNLVIGKNSKYNFRYVTYLLRNLYNIDFTKTPVESCVPLDYVDYLPIAREFGHLRSSITHDGGEITSNSNVQLKNTIKFVTGISLNGTNFLGKKLKITDELIYLACYMISDIISNINEHLTKGNTLNTNISTYTFQSGEGQN